ncbi:MAG: hypothetical protein KAW89_10010 [Armatimonadetes bacterium]|nr:hypothetical protein [Armatimonadota bacterium]
MSRLTVALMVVAMLALTSAAFGQGYFGQAYDSDAYKAWQLRAGYYDVGDAGSDIGFGADYMARDWMASADYVTTSNGGDLDIWSVSGTYLQRMSGRPGTYYGAGAGWYNLSENGWSDDGIGYHVLFGMEFGSPDQFGEPAWFAQARYLFGTDFGGGDVDGIQASVGRRF